MNYNITQIGTAHVPSADNGGVFTVALNKKYATGLTGLTGFTHAIIVWYANKAPAWQDEMLVMQAPYKGAPERMGVFATRSPFRPNGICCSTVEISSIDVKRGVITVPWFDMEDDTPILDIKPYHPSEDRVKTANVPEWCSSWPSCYEESGDFNWEDVFLF